MPERASPQVYKIGMPNVIFGFDGAGRMWFDQGVDVRSSDASATQGVDGWGANSASLGNLIMQPAEEMESRFPLRDALRGERDRLQAGRADHVDGECGR